MQQKSVTHAFLNRNMGKRTGAWLENNIKILNNHKQIKDF